MLNILDFRLNGVINSHELTPITSSIFLFITFIIISTSSYYALCSTYEISETTTYFERRQQGDLMTIRCVLSISTQYLLVEPLLPGEYTCTFTRTLAVGSQGRGVALNATYMKTEKPERKKIQFEIREEDGTGTEKEQYTDGDSVHLICEVSTIFSLKLSRSFYRFGRNES